MVPGRYSDGANVVLGLPGHQLVLWSAPALTFLLSTAPEDGVSYRKFVRRCKTIPPSSLFTLLISRSVFISYGPPSGLFLKTKKPHGPRNDIPAGLPVIVPSGPPCHSACRTLLSQCLPDPPVIVPTRPPVVPAGPTVIVPARSSHPLS